MDGIRFSEIHAESIEKRSIRNAYSAVFVLSIPECIGAYPLIDLVVIASRCSV